MLRHHRGTGRTEPVLDGLWYANGVALSPAGDYVLAVETMGLRVMRRWLRGPKQGETDVFIDSLPESSLLFLWLVFF